MDNIVADTLSRIETNALLLGHPPAADFAAMAKIQDTDPQIRCLQSSPTSTLVVEAVPLANSLTLSIAIHPLAHNDLWFHFLGDATLSTDSHIQVYVPPRNLSLPICLTWYQLRCSSLDSIICAVSMCQDPETYSIPIFFLSHSCQLFKIFFRDKPCPLINIPT